MARGGQSHSRSVFSSPPSTPTLEESGVKQVNRWINDLTTSHVPGKPSTSSASNDLVATAVSGGSETVRQGGVHQFICTIPVSVCTREESYATQESLTDVAVKKC